MAFVTETGLPLETKTVTEKVKTAQLNDSEGKLASGTENVGAQSVVLNTAIRSYLSCSPRASTRA